MDAGTLAAALGRSFGRFLESWGSDFDPEDPVDVRALAELLHDDLDRVVMREAAERAREMVEHWGGGHG
jgi:hypothetical protein